MAEQLPEKVIQEARQEAAKIVADAEASIAERRKTLDRRVQEIKDDATQHIEDERQRLSRRTEAAIAQAEERKRLALESRIYQAVEDGIVEALAGRRSGADYAALLAAWIVEAVQGLGGTEVIVGFPPEDQAAADSAVSEASKTLDSQGWKGSLRLDSETEVSGQGVLVKDAAGRKAFSNTVSDRIRRKRQDIYRITYNTVIEDRDD